MTIGNRTLLRVAVALSAISTLCAAVVFVRSLGRDESLEPRVERLERELTRPGRLRSSEPDWLGVALRRLEILERRVSQGETGTTVEDELLRLKGELLRARAAQPPR